jgi:putative ATPase
MQGLYFYAPRDLGYERTVAERLAVWRERDAEEAVEKRARRYADED